MVKMCQEDCSKHLQKPHEQAGRPPGCQWWYAERRRSGREFALDFDGTGDEIGDVGQGGTRGEDLSYAHLFKLGNVGLGDDTA